MLIDGTRLANSAIYQTRNVLGHQGLLHDQETGLIYNRARMLDPVRGRFIQRDPLGYIDGYSMYPYHAGMKGGVDATGMFTDSSQRRKRHQQMKQNSEWRKWREQRIEARVRRVEESADDPAECCEVRVIGSKAFGVLPVYHTGLEIEVMEDGCCVTYVAELAAFENEVYSSDSRLSAGGVAGPLGALGSLSTGGARDSSLAIAGGTADEAWGMYLQEGPYQLREGTELHDRTNLVGLSGQKGDCDYAKQVLDAVRSVAEGASGLGYDPLDRNCNSFLGQVTRESGGKVAHPGFVELAPGFDKNWE